MLRVKHAGNLLKDEVPSQTEYLLSCSLCVRRKNVFFSHIGFSLKLSRSLMFCGEDGCVTSYGDGSIIVT